MPKLGMTMEEGTVVEWHEQVGAAVHKGRILLVIESEKAEVEIESPIDGYLRHVYVDAGELVACGTLLAALTERADEAFDAETFRSANQPVSTAKSERTRLAEAAAAPATNATTMRAGGDTTRVPVTPAARRRAKELGLDPTVVPGSGPGGRVTIEDVDAYGERMASRVEVASGVRLDVQSRGSGETLVLLPGFGTDASAFAPQIADLADQWRVLAVNQRGVAFSDAPETERYDIATAAEDATHLADGALHVIGASMGAAIAIELALTHPERVRSLTLITPLVSATARLQAVTEAWIAAATAGADVLGTMLVAWMFSEEFLADDGRRERAARSIAQTCGRIPTATLVRWAAGIRAWSGTRTGALSRIAVPTLIIAADEDVLTPNADAIARAIPSAHLTTIERAGHAVSIEKPADVSRLIRAHLSAVPSVA